MVQTTNISYGWVCPRCETVNSPFKHTCDCVPKGQFQQSRYTTTVVNETDLIQWTRNNGVSGGVAYTDGELVRVE